MEYLLESLEQTQKFAHEICEKINPGDVLALHGELGSGKTTFTRYLVEALDIKDRVQSPTFVIVRKYGSDDLTVNHVDLYRLHSKEEVEDIGLQELINEENSIIVIEWPEKAKSLLPDSTINMYFEFVNENTRKVNVQNLN